MKFKLCFLLANITAFAAPNIAELSHVTDIHLYDDTQDRGSLIDLFESERKLLTQDPNYSPQKLLNHMATYYNDAQQHDSSSIGVIRHENKCIGFVVFGVHADGIGYIDALCVHTDFRGKGYGKILIEYAIKTLQKKNTKEIRLYTAIDNYKAQMVYIKCKFEELYRKETHVCYRYTQ
jgi:ribosomal protein S18 acetylase RimI-like enzyme